MALKKALRELKFKKYNKKQIYLHRKFNFQNGAFEPERSFTDIKFQKVW
jgi:hypothetical protein